MANQTPLSDAAVMPTYGRADLSFVRGEGSWLYTADDPPILIVQPVLRSICLVIIIRAWFRHYTARQICCGIHLICIGYQNRNVWQNGWRRMLDLIMCFSVIQELKPMKLL